MLFVIIISLSLSMWVSVSVFVFVERGCPRSFSFLLFFSFFVFRFDFKRTLLFVISCVKNVFGEKERELFYLL